MQKTAAFTSSWLGKERTSGWLTRVYDTAEVLFRQIFDPNDKRPAGLIVISGSTGTGKSEILRSIIHQYLASVVQAHRPGDRLPHLVTFEDPIERYLYTSPPLEMRNASGGSDKPIDYTPRELGPDVCSLREALKDALRQTPAVFYVGETRNPKYWPRLIHFAGTGHLIVTTAHAGTLSESLGHILNANKAHTPASRSVIASRVLAVVHLRVLRTKNGNKAVIPALWKGTLQSRMSLVSDGLSSVLPHRHITNGSAGRAWFAGNLGRCWGSSGPDILAAALRADLEER